MGEIKSINGEDTGPLNLRDIDGIAINEVINVNAEILTDGGGGGPAKLSTPAIPTLQYAKGKIFVQFDNPIIAEDSYVESHEIWRIVEGLFILYDTVVWTGTAVYWDMSVSLGNTYGYKIKRISNDGGTDDSNLSLPGVITI